jgi:hypothetical protein
MARLGSPPGGIPGGTIPGVRHRPGIGSGSTYDLRVDERLLRAKSRLDRLDWWPRPVCIDHVRIFAVPCVFRVPWLARFDGYAVHGVILLRNRNASTDLVTHELCHVWQMQHRPLRMPLSYLRTGYAANGYERQARAAVDATRSGSDEHGAVP